MSRLFFPFLFFFVNTLEGFCQTSGSLDASFQTSASFGPNVFGVDKANLICIPATDGKFFALGNFSLFSGHPTKGLARVFDDGRVDASFAVSFEKANFDKIVVLGNGKILAFGSFIPSPGSPQKSLVRLKENGELDPGFILPASFVVHSLPFANDSHIYIGEGANYNFAKTLRLFANGDVDSSFQAIPGVLSQIELLPDGRFIGGSNNWLCRFKTNGQKDSSFTLYSEPWMYDRPLWQLLPSGNIWIASQNSSGRFGLKFLSTNGIVTKTYNNNRFNSGTFPGFKSTKNDGSVTLAYTDSLHLNLVTLLPDGRLDTNTIVHLPANSSSQLFRQGNGWATLLYRPINNAYPTNPVLVRYDSLGHETGRKQASGFDGTVTKVYTQKDSKILVLGNFTGYDTFRSPYLMRLHSNGLPDTSFHSPFSGIHQDGQTPEIQKVHFTAQDKILLQGFPFGYGKTAFKDRMMMLNPNGSIDHGFQLDTSGLYGSYWDGACLMPNQKIYLKLDGAETRIYRFHLDGSRDEDFTPKVFRYNYPGPGGYSTYFTGMHQGHSNNLYLDFSYPSNFNCTPDPGGIENPPMVEKILKLDLDGNVDSSFHCGPFMAGEITELTENQLGHLFATIKTGTGGFGPDVFGFVHVLPNGRADSLFCIGCHQIISTSLNAKTAFLVTPQNNTLLSLFSKDLVGLCTDGSLNIGMQTPEFSAGDYSSMGEFGTITSLALADSTHFYAAGMFNHVGTKPVHSLVKIHYSVCATTSMDSRMEKVRKPVLYPNPGENRFQINYPYPSQWKSEIFDAKGKKFNSSVSIDETEVFRTDGLPRGLYHIRIWDKNSSFVVPWVKK